MGPVSVKGAGSPLVEAPRGPCHVQRAVHLPQELGASYKNGNFLEIQLHVFIITLGNQGNNF